MSETKPKEMTDTQLCGLLSNPFGIDDAPKTRDVREELLRRLDEADALRKENVKLRNALIDARSWMDAGMFEDVPPQYTAMVANVDAVLSKESEASHE
jgi:hypothetical protein